jgi:hypothetical protein
MPGTRVSHARNSSWRLSSCQTQLCKARVSLPQRDGSSWRGEQHVNAARRSREPTRQCGKGSQPGSHQRARVRGKITPLLPQRDKINVASMNPTASCKNLLSEKAPWPHSCATTQHPVATVPVTMLYKSQRGHMANFKGIWRPTKRHARVKDAEMAAYPIDLTVSRLKQCSGIAWMTSFFEGYSMPAKASPLRPETSTFDASPPSAAMVSAGRVAVARTPRAPSIGRPILACLETAPALDDDLDMSTPA